MILWLPQSVFNNVTLWQILYLLLSALQNGIMMAADDKQRKTRFLLYLQPQGHQAIFFGVKILLLDPV